MMDQKLIEAFNYIDQQQAVIVEDLKKTLGKEGYEITSVGFSELNKGNVYLKVSIANRNNTLLTFP